jgi:hypothetical protein
MPKRSRTTRQAKATSTRSAARTPAPEAPGAVERQVLAFAEQLGYVAGSIQSKAGDLMERETLSRQVAGVRDGAKHLLAQLARQVTTRVRRAPAPEQAPRTVRSGGTVDAPGKKHRKPAPAGPAKATTRSQTAKVRAATPMAKTYRRRARG